MNPETIAEFFESYRLREFPDMKTDGTPYRMMRKAFLYGAWSVLAKIDARMSQLEAGATGKQQGDAMMAALADSQNELRGLLHVATVPEPRLVLV